ncbi:hypothetical protein DWF04_021480 [Cereibacter sphaeroides f. sp. denitrificans]|nr:hypothetical protein DWF04_13200 [Cereibacter sphaeroides f. sp. denitrificans]
MAHYEAKDCWDRGINVDVWLDGVEQSDVLEADTDAGYIVRAKLNETGKPYLIGDEVATERVTGVVTVRERPRPAP